MAEMTNTHWNGSDMEKTVYEKKYIYKEDTHNDEYASKGVAGTALGIGIGALALTVLGRNGLGNLLNWNNDGVDRHHLMDDDFFRLYKSQVDADFALYKGYRDQDDAIVAKNNADAFSLYKYSRDGFDAVQAELNDLKTKMAVMDAVQPWKDKAIYDAIALEAERRSCNDDKIVNYANCTFIPKYIADMTPAATSTQKQIFNPLCSCGFRGYF